MTRTEIIELAKQCGGDICEFGMNAIEGLQFYNMEQLEAFFHAAQKLERDEIADDLEHGFVDDEGHHIQYAADIRNRSKT